MASNYTTAGPGTNELVKVAALDGQGPRILAYENLIEEQAQAMFVAASFGQDPMKALQEKQTAIRIYFEPLKTEDLLT